VSTDKAGYSGTPLPRKLGIKAGHQVLLDNAPDGFELAPLPAGATVDHAPDAGPYDVTLMFCPDADALRERWDVLHPRTAPAGGLWVAWPKKAAEIPTDLDDGIVRQFGLTHGRVDVKVCAVDAQWSGLKFVVRLADR
jgi:hypothetical protein